MHKIIKRILLSLVIATGFALLPAQVSHASTSESNVTQVTIPQYLNNISRVHKVNVKRFYNLIKNTNKKPFYFFFGFKECPYCRKFSPVLKEFMQRKNTLPIYYVDVTTFGSKDRQNVKMSKAVNNFITTKVKLKTTPTIVGIRKGHIIGSFRESSTKLSQLVKLNHRLLS